MMAPADPERYEIGPLRPQEVGEACRLIYVTAFRLIRDRSGLAKAVAHFESPWALPDIFDYQNVYLKNGGAYLALRAPNGRILGTGALRRLEPGVCELKRLWFLPEDWGRGLGFRMLRALLAEARRRGYHTARLETSRTYQQRAIAFYRQGGFTEIQPFGSDPDSAAFELRL